jgi:hypothetical protein
MRPCASRKPGDGDALGDLHAAGARALRVGHGERIRVDVTVGGDPGRAAHVLEVDQREAVLHLIRADELEIEAVALRRGRGALQFLPARIAAREPDRADIAPADILIGLRADGLAELRASTASAA